jgi:outer membrane protein
LAPVKRTSFLGLAILFVLAAAAGGCRSVDSPASPDTPWIPPEWAAEEAARRPSTTPVPSADLSAALTLADCVDIALANNPATRRAWAQARAAVAVLGQAGSLRYPRLTVSGSGSYERQEYNLKDEDSGLAADMDGFVYGPALELTYLLFDFGGVSGGIEEARQALLAANFSFNQSLQDLLLEVEQAYYRLNAYQAALTAAEADVEDARTADEAATQRYEVGLSSKLDQLQARSTYQDSLYRLEQARGDLQTGRADLAAALGLPADTEFTLAGPAEGVPETISGDDVSRLIEEGLRRRPDIAVLRAQVRAREAAVKTAASSLYPALNLGGSADKLWYSYNDDPELYDDSYSYTGYLALKWDIFSGFGDREKKRQAEAEAAAAREELASAEIQASSEVWTKYYAFQTSVKRYGFSRSYLETARESYSLAREGYDTGLKSILDLLQSQSALSSARSQVIEAERDVFIALADLAHATGTLTREGLTPRVGEGGE